MKTINEIQAEVLRQAPDSLIVIPPEGNHSEDYLDGFAAAVNIYSKKLKRFADHIEKSQGRNQ